MTATTTTVREAPTVLTSGWHEGPGDGMNLPEAVAYVAGEHHTENPECCCPVLAKFGGVWSDGMRSDTERSQLLQYIDRLVGTRSSHAVEEQRSELAMWWLIRDYAPVWLDLADLDNHAASLRTMQRLDQHTLDTANDAVWGIWQAVPYEAESVAQKVAVEATGATGGRSAYRAVDHPAVGMANSIHLRDRVAGNQMLDCLAAAWTTAAVAGYVAAARHAWGAVPDEHWDALQQDTIRAGLEPTIKALQKSTHQLFDEMITVGEQ